MAPSLACTISISLASYLLCRHSIPSVALKLQQAGITGRDVHKPARPVLAESLGLATGAYYILALITQMLFIDTHAALAVWCAAAMSVCCMILVGFADDVLDVRWRHKLLLPAIASLPLLVIYRFTTGGITSILLPWPLCEVFGRKAIEIGYVYYVWMLAVSVFCTHSINILAGINGLEVGQVLVISVYALVSYWIENNLVALHLLLPFFFTSAALWQFNSFPARVFVGDVYTYSAGMVLAVSAILGHSTKTLMLWFALQAVNFVYSLPQLLKVIPCPRHRMPDMVVAEGDLPVLTYSTTDITGPNRVLQFALLRLHRLGFVALSISKTVAQNEARTQPVWTISNLTLPNLVLVHLGPMREDELCGVMLGIQAAICTLGMLVRHPLARFFFSYADRVVFE